MPIHEILFPTDFSEVAQYAGRYATLLARKLDAGLHVLHALPPTLGKLAGLALTELHEAARRKAEADLEELLQGEGWHGLRIRTTVAIGLIEEEILKAAEGSDLIVMGAHGWTGLSRALLGSVTEKVARISPCGVLAIRHPEVRVELPWGRVLGGRWKAKEQLELQRILVPLDGSALAESALPEVKELARPFEASLTLLRVIPPYLSPGVKPPEEFMARDQAEAEGYLKTKQQELEAEGFSIEVVVRAGDAAHEILDYAEAREVDLIAMATHGRSGLSRWLLGSIAEKVLRGSDIPVLLHRAWTPSKGSAASRSS